MARKGTATVKTANKDDRYIYVDSDSDDINPTSTTSEKSNIDNHRGLDERGYLGQEFENVDPAAAREQLNLSSPLKPLAGPEYEDRQPRQASATVEQSRTLANHLFPSYPDNNLLPSIEDLEPPAFRHSTSSQPQTQRPVKKPRSRIQTSAASRSRASGAGNAATDANLAAPTQGLNLTLTNGTHPHQNSRDNPPADYQPYENTTRMIPGGAYIAPNQQRNMRACMVCSIVRTQQQFMANGCPNCDDILELVGNSEQINDCTSQVFDGLISIADTKRSWVARYQRLEGYVAGVYATQVEGILPEDVIVAVENAGINYVPRDGSEQEMLPKD